MAEGGGEGEGSNDKFRLEFVTHICPPGLAEGGFPISHACVNF